ncbi:MAG: tRNA (guanosine(46)-N7)-methyltransferase TrmB [Propionivibrio sp.]|uniref:tRNA (guanine-N(7)-)-methyltransferase n=1 Tax=Candidatus Propionivibrio dominans TaxID=2954373 RepID=A0A9D7I6B5_9RHOO|nr:tRNA (guanosine(46)-N7)-methyltransferase TrmB [Candidatus Propionivibrio dominans]
MSVSERLDNITPAGEPGNTHRHIRSFVLRQGRVSNAQLRYYEAMMAEIGVPYVAVPLDLESLFGRSADAAPKILEIGFGMGETSATIAAANPQNDYLGIEVHTPGVGSLCKRIAEGGLSNLRIVQHDAVEVLRDMIRPGTLSGAHIFFPDPWPKLRHHKRRLIQPPLVALLASRLRPGGYIHCATDWEEYAQQMLAVLSAEPLLENTAVDYAPRPEYRPLTRFEQRGLRLGHGVWDVIFRRRPDLLQTEDDRQDQFARAGTG